MKNLVVFANCQGGAVAKTLLESHSFSSGYKLVEIPPVQSIKAGQVQRVLEVVREADLFLYQPIAESPNRPPEMTSDYLLKLLKRGAKSLSFPSLYFDGYFPHLKSLNGLSASLNLVHDYFIVYSYVIGLSVARTCDMLQSDRLYSPKVSQRLFLQSLKELERREANSQTDITVSGYIKQHYQSRKLFNQFNHPTRPLISYVAESLLEAVGCDNDINPQSGKGYLEAIATPVYPSTYNNLNLLFKEEFEWYTAAGGKRVSQQALIESFFSFYSGLDKETLRKAVMNHKPFVAELVDAYVGGKVSWLNKLKCIFNR